MTARSSDWRPSPTVCRCCFAEGCYKDISTEYFWMGKREVYSEMLSDTFDVSIAYSQSGGPNSHSRLICEPCISRLRDASDFKRQVQECERVFMQHLDPGSSSLQLESETEQPVTVKEVKIERVKKEQELTDDDDFGDMSGFPDDDDDDLDDQPLQTLASKVPKKESVELMELIENPKPVKRKSTRVKAVPVKKAKKSTPKASASKEEPKTEKKKKDPVRDDAVRKNAITILRHSTAYPFQPSVKRSFRCCFCPFVASELDDPEVFRKHMDKTHKQTDKAKCLKHPNDSMTRVDITNLRCKKKDCNEEFQTLEDLANHLIEIHGHTINLTESFGLVPMRLQQGRFSCIICPKICTTLQQLSRHAGSHFHRNICYKCGSNFETLKGIRKHVLLAHSNHKFMCQICLMSFPDMKAKKIHLRTSEKCQQIRCKICKERFLCAESKQDHMEKVHGFEKVIYKCPECTEVFNKRIHRYLHFKKFHTDDFKCNHCEMRFSTIRCLKDHIARVHTLEKPHICSYCGKAFTAQRTLRTHLLLHDESKKSTCPVCSRSFTIKIRLKYHIQKCHPEMSADIPALFARKPMQLYPDPPVAVENTLNEPAANGATNSNDLKLN